MLGMTAELSIHLRLRCTTLENDIIDCTLHIKKVLYIFLWNNVDKFKNKVYNISSQVVRVLTKNKSNC